MYWIPLLLQQLRRSHDLPATQAIASPPGCWARLVVDTSLWEKITGRTILYEYLVPGRVVSGFAVAVLVETPIMVDEFAREQGAFARPCRRLVVLVHH